MSIGVILLAGGIGRRMGTESPKQFLPLRGSLVLEHSLSTFLESSLIEHIVVVCAPEFRLHLSPYPSLSFALPGERRQDSVWNGLQELPSSCSFVCVHDGARPLLNAASLERVLSAAQLHGASALGAPVSNTIKEVTPQGEVLSTPNRETLWEVYTPQVLRRDWLEKGFSKARENHLTVTDDLSLIDLVGFPSTIVEGVGPNLKLTYPEDLAIAETLLNASEARHV